MTLRASFGDDIPPPPRSNNLGITVAGLIIAAAIVWVNYPHAPPPGPEPIVVVNVTTQVRDATREMLLSKAANFRAAGAGLRHNETRESVLKKLQAANLAAGRKHQQVADDALNSSPDSEPQVMDEIAKGLELAAGKK